MNCPVRLADSAEKVARCYKVMREVRPHLRAETFVARVQRQQEEGGYRLVFIESNGHVRAAAGYRIGECLAWGRFLYVDDLVTCAADRGQGWGSQLFDWLVQEAHRQSCQQFHLDSGVQRFGAHRFYLHKGMDITAHHFALRFQRAGEQE